MKNQLGLRSNSGFRICSFECFMEKLYGEGLSLSWEMETLSDMKVPVDELQYSNRGIRCIKGKSEFLLLPEYWTWRCKVEDINAWEKKVTLISSHNPSSESWDHSLGNLDWKITIICDAALSLTDAYRFDRILGKYL